MVKMYFKTIDITLNYQLNLILRNAFENMINFVR